MSAGAAWRSWAALVAGGVLACASLAGCSGGDDSGDGGASVSPSASSSVAQSPATQLTDWGTWTPTEDGRGIFRSDRLGFSVELPAIPEVDPPAEGDEFETVRLRVDKADGSGAAAVVTVEKLLDEQKERLAPMSVEEQTAELGYYIQGFVGSAEYLADVVSMPLGQYAGLRYRATNFDADLWTVLGSQRLYTVATYGLDDADTILVLGSLTLSE